MVAERAEGGCCPHPVAAALPDTTLCLPFLHAPLYCTAPVRPGLSAKGAVPSYCARLSLAHGRTRCQTLGSHHPIFGLRQRPDPAPGSGDATRALLVSAEAMPTSGCFPTAPGKLLSGAARQALPHRPAPAPTTRGFPGLSRRLGRPSFGIGPSGWEERSPRLGSACGAFTFCRGNGLPGNFVTSSLTKVVFKIPVSTA